MIKKLIAACIVTFRALFYSQVAYSQGLANTSGRKQYGA